MKNKVIAYSMGIACHLLFASAIFVMAIDLFEGATISFFPLGEYGRALNILLLLQFPIFHSFFLSKTGRRLLEKPFPQEIGGALTSTTFSLISSVQILLVFLFWTPSSEIWFAPSGMLLYLMTALYGISWVLLIIAIKEAGISLQTGALGWMSIVKGEKPKYPRFCETGLHGKCRHPIYLSFALIILTGPVWGVDHLILAIIWVTYCVAGPLLKERRYLKIYGAAYQLFRQRTPYLLPKLFSIIPKD